MSSRMKKPRKPRDIDEKNFYAGIDTYNSEEKFVFIGGLRFHVNTQIHVRDPKDMRKLAAYLIKCADYLESKEGTK